MKKLLDNPYLVAAARLVLGLVFILASVDKLADAGTFAKSIQNYDIMPMAVINLIALVLPWLEIICGLFLVFGVRVKASAGILGILLAVFIVAILSAVIRGLDISCGCFSQDGDGTKVGWQKLAENSGLLILAVYVYLLPYTRLSRSKG